MPNIYRLRPEARDGAAEQLAKDPSGVRAWDNLWQVIGWLELANERTRVLISSITCDSTRQQLLGESKSIDQLIEQLRREIISRTAS